MGSTEFRTENELKRAQWAEKYLSVVEGKLYTNDALSPFPIHEYFKLGLLGKNIRMMEMNAGHALVEHMVADTLTDVTITVNEKTDGTEVQEIRDWMEAEDFDDTLEEAARNLYGAGYCVAQPFRLKAEEGVLDNFRVANLDPATWYPDTPTFLYQEVTSGRIISVFSETDNTSVKWYAFVERHTIGQIEYELYRLEGPSDLKGAKISLNTLSQFSKLQESAKTELDYLAVFQQNRQKRSGELFGQSVLAPIWGPLQEVSEIQTQIRQERIKHFRSKLAVPRKSLQRVEPEKKTTGVEKFALETQQETGARYNANQEVFPIDGDVLPGYITWDMKIIEAGSNEIDKLHNRMASYTGFPRSVFNLDEKGEVHVDTEKRKNVRYVRKVMQGQRRMAVLVKTVLETRHRWKTKGEPPKITVSFANPFEMSQEEVVKLMREQNPDAVMVSEKEAVRQVWKKKTPEEIDRMQREIDEEREMQEPPPTSQLNNVRDLKL